MRNPAPQAVAGMLVLGLSTLASPGATAQPAATAQKVTGPQARYWVSAETGTGMSAAAMQGGGLGSIMGAMFGGGGPRKTLRLELGGQRDGNPSEAVHTVPGGLGMGPSLTLLGPERAVATPERPERDVPEMQRGERPKGRMLFFWGCGETAGPGQPVIFDIEKMADGVLPPNMRSIAVNGYRGGPGAGRDRGYADWPNRRHSEAVPGGASLVGDHLVQGNFVPDIRFAVGAPHDFMEPLTLKRAANASGSQLLGWNRPASALGYFVTGMGFKEGPGGANDMVMWNSSTARLLGGEQLNTFLPPAETERLVKAGVVLPPARTECTVPREVLAAAGGDLMMLNLNAFGPELNVVHPPRPQDARVTWEQQYHVRLRLRSYTGSVGGMDGAAAAQRPERADEAPARDAKDEKAPKPADAVKDLLKGIFGR